MTRVIAGTARGHRLRTPRGDATRPTSDRVREALFSAWEARLGSFEGLHVLDLYAGSGAVGLEAASRGAARVTLVEHDRRTAALVRANAADLARAGVSARVDVVCARVARHLAVPPADEDDRVDVVFADPPYPLADEAVEDDLVALVTGWLAPEAVVVVERSARAAPVRWPAGLGEERVRSYGDTRLSLAVWAGG